MDSGPHLQVVRAGPNDFIDQNLHAEAQANGYALGQIGTRSQSYFVKIPLQYLEDAAQCNAWIPLIQPSVRPAPQYSYPDPELYSNGVEYNPYPQGINPRWSLAAFQPRYIADRITDAAYRTEGALNDGDFTMNETNQPPYSHTRKSPNGDLSYNDHVKPASLIDPALSDESQDLKVAPSVSKAPASRPTRRKFVAQTVAPARRYQAAADTNIRAAFDATSAGEYNPGWMADHNIDKILLDVMDSTDDTPSQMKWDALFTRGVIVPGDRLRVTFPLSTTNAASTVVDAEVLSRAQRANGSKPTASNPDVRIRWDHIVQGCKGPTELLKEMNAKYGHLGSADGGWQGINLVRNGRDFGSVSHVRVVYVLWMHLHKTYKPDEAGHKKLKLGKSGSGAGHRKPKIG